MSCTRISIVDLLPPLLQSHALSDKRASFQSGTNSPVDPGDGDRLCKYYARAVARLFDLLVCYVPRAAYANNTPYANRHCGLNACLQSRVSSSIHRRIFRSFHSCFRNSPVDKCHRSSIANIDRHYCENILPRR